MTIDNSGKPARRLPYPLQNPLEETPPADNTGTVTQFVAGFFPSDMDEKVNVLFNMSFNEFTSFTSAIDIGRDIGWENSNDVYRAWIKALIGIGSLPVSCEDIADCIESEIAEGNTELINSLTQNMINNGFGNPNRINPALTTVLDRNPVGALQEDVKELLNCDLNALWGGIRHGIVERLDDNARDLLEDLAAIPNTLERLAVFVDVVPIMGDIVEGVAFQITEVIPDLLDLFDSFSSLEALDTIACEIFAIVCAECRYPTFEEVFNVYFADSLSGLPALANMTLNDIAQALLDIVTNPAAIAYNTMLVWELFTLNAQAAFNGQNGSSAIVKMAEIGEDFGSDNWLDICDSCADSYVLWTWDFTTQGIGEFYPDTAQNTSKAVFQAGLGWRAVNHSTGRRFDVAMPFDPTWEIRAVAYNVEGATDTGHNWIRRPTWGSTTGQSNSSAGSSGTEWSYYYDGYASLTGINEVVFFAQFAAGATAILTKVSILFNVGKSPTGNSVPSNDLTPYA